MTKRTVKTMHKTTAAEEKEMNGGPDRQVKGGQEGSGQQGLAATVLLTHPGQLVCTLFDPGRERRLAQRVSLSHCPQSLFSGYS